MANRRPKAGKPSGDRMAEILANLETTAEKAQKAAGMADVAPVQTVLAQFETIRERWEGMPGMFDGDMELMKRVHGSLKRIMVVMLDSLEQIVTQVNQRILDQNKPNPVEPMDLNHRLRIFESFSTQVASFQPRQPAAAPKTETPVLLPSDEADLDRRIAEAEQAANRNGKTTEGDIDG